MRAIIAFIIGLTIGLLIGSSSSNAGSLAQGFGSNCGPRNTVLAQLQKRYAEVPVAMGLASNGSVIEVLVAPSGSFTIILTIPSGLACVMAAGEAWERLAPKAEGPKT